MIKKDEEFVTNLKKGGFIYDGDVDEVETLKFLQKSVQFSGNSLSLTVAPTLGCNFGCTYCYQGEHNTFEKMTSEVQEDLINFIKARIKKISMLSITWYGGEPLLAMDIIESLTNKFIELCSENNISYNAGIITNGYHLNPETAQKLVDLKVTSVQVTLDGPKEYHDLKRPLKDGSGTFDGIISNLKQCKGIFKSGISLRVNTDHINKDKVKDIIDILKENDLLTDVLPYLGHVDATNEFYDNEKCLTPDDFLNVKKNFINELCKYVDIEPVLNQYPQVTLNACLADSDTGYVIDPSGNLSKCWCDIDIDEFKVGTLKDGITKFGRIVDYFNYDIFSDPKCVDCKIVPICLGGCPRRRIDNVHQICTSTKESLYNTIIETAKQRDSTLSSLELYEI